MFEPFAPADFALLARMSTPASGAGSSRSGSAGSDAAVPTQLPPPLAAKAEELRRALDAYPELQLDFLRRHVVRRPMRGEDGLAFSRPKLRLGYAEGANRANHWFMIVVGGVQDQVQFNIGMFPDHLRVGLGFQLGTQIRSARPPALLTLQTLLTARPPLPFRADFARCLRRNQFQLEHEGAPIAAPTEQLISYLETYVPPLDAEPAFLFIGAVWTPEQAATHPVADYYHVFRELLPTYQALLLLSGRLTWLPD